MTFLVRLSSRPTISVGVCAGEADGAIFSSSRLRAIPGIATNWARFKRTTASRLRLRIEPKGTKEKQKTGVARFVCSVKTNRSYLLGRVESAEPELQKAYYLAKFGVRNLRQNGILIFDRPQPKIGDSPPCKPTGRGSTLTAGGVRIVPMKCSLQFVTSPTADTPGTCVSLIFDNKRYLIGQIAEGTQRASTQTGNKFTKTQSLFLTGLTSWKSVGGIMGLILTVSDMVIGQKRHIIDTIIARAARQGQRLTIDQAGKELDPKKYSLDIYGADNLMHAIATCRRFIFRRGVPLNVFECRDQTLKLDEDGNPIPTWSDDMVKVWALVASPGPKRSHRPVSANSSGSVGSTGSRKRSFSDVVDDQGDPARFSDIRRAVVSEMFSSDWRLDNLQECSLLDVNGPAKIFVRDEVSNQLRQYTGPVPWRDGKAPDIRVFVRRPWPAALVEYLPPTETSKEAVSYIFKTFPVRGKFLPAKALELGVERGPAFARLTRGESVTTAAGATVTAEMVLEPSVAGSAIAVLDIPFADYIGPTLDRAEWQHDDISGRLVVIVWILGPGLADHPDVKAFMDARPGVRHVVSSQDSGSNRVAMDSSFASTTRLAHLDSDRFVPIHHTGVGGSDETHEVELDPSGRLEARRELDITILPRFAVRHRKIHHAAAADPTETIPADAVALAESARTQILADSDRLAEWAASVPGGDVEIMPLGTGSSVPSLLRNVSATLIRVPGVGSYLLDCGENTIGQLKRAFGDQTDEVLRDLRMIWISHLHADHHLGTAGVLKAWYQAVYKSQPNQTSLDVFALSSALKSKSRPAPWGLSVVSEPAMLRWLAEYSQCEDIGYSRIVPLFKLNSDRQSDRPDHSLHLYSHQFDKSGPDSSSTTLAPRVDPVGESVIGPLLGLSKLDTCFVPHCHGAQAVALTWPDGFKVAYSGDTRPSPAFVRIGQGATVCIHEATFETGMESEAKAKRHSTTAEAVSIATAMNARTCLLTHFSQRYPKIPEIPDMLGLSASFQRAHRPTTTTTSAGSSSESAGKEGEAGDDYHVDDIEDDCLSADSGETGVGRLGGSDKAVKRPREGGDSPLEVCIAFDLMRVRVKDIPKLGYFYPAFQRLLEDDENAEADEAGSADDQPVVTGTQSVSQPAAKSRKAKQQKKKQSGQAGGKVDKCAPAEQKRASTG